MIIIINRVLSNIQKHPGKKKNPKNQECPQCTGEQNILVMIISIFTNVMHNFNQARCWHTFNLSHV